MAIDSSLFCVDVPAGTYAKGDILNLGINLGPANVRSGRGSAILKQITAVNSVSTSQVQWRVYVKNSDWIDSVASIIGRHGVGYALDDHSGCVQFGCDASLTANSGWMVYAECIKAGTTTAANTIFCLIDVDYPSVSAVTDPDNVVGIPTTITFDLSNAPVLAAGSISNAAWSIKNVDYLKAGYQYCIQSVEMYSSSTSLTGFVAFSSAAGMGGLQRIIPVGSDPASIRYKLRYASKLVKGPMDVKTLFIDTAASTADISMCHDFVKRAIS